MWFPHFQSLRSCSSARDADDLRARSLQSVCPSPEAKGEREEEKAEIETMMVAIHSIRLIHEAVMGTTLQGYLLPTK